MGSDRSDSSSESEAEVRRPTSTMSDSGSDQDQPEAAQRREVASSDSSSDDEPANSPPPPESHPMGGGTPTGGMSTDNDSDNEVQVTKMASDSGSDSDNEKQQKSQDIPSSSEDEADGEPKTEMKNIFGDMSSDESDGGGQKKEEPMSDDDDKRDVTTIPVEIPKINTNLGDQIHFVRFPNFLSVEPRPFDPEFYEDEVEEDDDLDEEGRTRLKLKVENTIRWRKSILEDGTEKIESNAKIVKWSDGTQSLILGSEKYDVQSMKLKGDFNHLFIRQGTGLQGQAVFQTKLTFRPSSTNSLTHKKIMGRLAQRINNPMQKVKVIPVCGADPHKERERLIREADEKGRAEMRREQAKQRIREKQARKNMASGYLEDNEDDYSLNRLKNDLRRRDHEGSDTSEDEYERRGVIKKFEHSDDDEEFARRRHKSNESNDSIEAPKHKKHVIRDSDSDENSDKKSESEKSDKSTMSDSD